MGTAATRTSGTPVGYAAQGRAGPEQDSEFNGLLTAAILYIVSTVPSRFAKFACVQAYPSSCLDICVKKLHLVDLCNSEQLHDSE
jgi:hypothetical protein